MKIKNILPFILIFALLICFASCISSNENDQSANNGNNDGSGDNGGDTLNFAPDLAALRENMISTFGGEEPIKFESDILLDLYGISAEDVSESACYMTMDGVFPQEIIMIKASSTEAVARISASLENRIDEVKTQSENYDPENYALAQKCKVQTRGLYVTMFLSPSFDQMTEMFNSAK